MFFCAYTQHNVHTIQNLHKFYTLIELYMWLPMYGFCIYKKPTSLLFEFLHQQQQHLPFYFATYCKSFGPVFSYTKRHSDLFRINLDLLRI